MKRILIVLLVLSLGLVVGAERAEASENPFSMQLEDWNVELVNPREQDTSTLILGRTDVKLDETMIQTLIKRPSDTQWVLLSSDVVSYLVNDDSVIASIRLANTFFTSNLKIMLKYDGHESPELNFCYYAASTVMSDICANPFKWARGANTLEELENGRIRLIAKLNRAINKDVHCQYGADMSASQV